MTPTKNKNDDFDMSLYPSSSRKRMKRSEPFDLAVVDAALDLEFDIDEEYEKGFYGEEENYEPNKKLTSHGYSEKNRDTCCNTNKGEHEKHSRVVLENASEYDEYLSRVRKHVHYLNTIEDDEETTFSVRAKLFEYVKGYDHFFDALSSHLFPANTVDGPARWAERGTGHVKFLRDLEEGITYGTVRISMQHEGTLKLLMNHIVEPGLEATSTKDKKGRRHYMWCCKDLAMGVSRRTFALRFSNDRDALSWKENFEKMKKATGDARTALDPDCYALPGTPSREKATVEPEEATYLTDIGKTLPFTPLPKSTIQQKRRRLSV